MKDKKQRQDNGFHLVDFHAHILPGLDHGSDSTKTTAFQLARAIECGIDKIIATSHFYPHAHSLEAFVCDREKSYSHMLDKSFTAFENPPQIILGAEVLLCPGLENLVGIDKLCIQGTKTLLIELPFHDFGNEYVKTVEALIELGYDIVLAHADRYPVQNIDILLECGAKIQLNADALQNRLFIGKKHLLRWLEDGFVVALGSDIHGLDKKAYKRFLKAEKTVEKYLDYIHSHSLSIFNAKDTTNT